MSSYINKMHFK